jgi:TRAP-type C4-dicarboxylate transport system permease small subunit
MSMTTDSDSSASPNRTLARIDTALGWLVSLPAAALVAIEIVLLFVGVVARYVFHKPLIIADELSSVLFLWLAMMGASVSLHRNAHMRMTALVNDCNDVWRARWEWVSNTACLCFLALLAEPSFDYLMQQLQFLGRDLLIFFYFKKFFPILL